MDLNELLYFKERFEDLNLNSYESDRLISIINAAISSFDKIEYKDDIHHSFYWEVWGLLSEIGDHVVSKEDLKKIKAMNAEFAGHTLTYRLSKGWLQRVENAPTEFKNFSSYLQNDEFIG